MYTLTVKGPKETRIREYTVWLKARKAFHNATYLNPDAIVTLTAEGGKTIRKGANGKTQESSK